MALAMARPWKHPKTGIYWFRKRVPDELRGIIGKLEEKRSLNTRDPAEAKVRHLEMLSDIEARWRNLRAGPKTITEKEAHELAHLIHHQWLGTYRDNPREQTFWRTDLYERLWTPPADWDTSVTVRDNLVTGLDKGTLYARDMESWCHNTADACLNARGFMVDGVSRDRMARAIAAAVQRASIGLEGLARGDFDDASTGLSGSWTTTPAGRRNSAPASPVKLGDLFTGWAAERQPAPKTLYEWSRVVRQLTTFLGHDDAQRLTAEDLIRWKDSMVSQGLRPKTIRDAKITPVRAVLQWAADNRRLPSNPAQRIVIELRHKASESKRSFTDAEAAIVLSAALLEKDSVRRWVPWLCAYSGARLAEVCQLRFEDIVEIEGIWCMRFDPEAGSLKTRGSERAIPLHPAVIEQGFLKFVESVGTGPLFPELPPDKFGSRGGNGTKVLGPWVRALGLTDSRISPNHSWRHRFKTLGRRHGLAPDIVNAMTGHGRRSVADSYGEFEMAAMYREVVKIPTLATSCSDRPPVSRVPRSFQE